MAYKNVFMISLQTRCMTLTTAEPQRIDGCVFAAAPAKRKENCSAADLVCVPAQGYWNHVTLVINWRFVFGVLLDDLAEVV